LAENKKSLSSSRDEKLVLAALPPWLIRINADPLNERCGNDLFRYLLPVNVGRLRPGLHISKRFQLATPERTSVNHALRVLPADDTLSLKSWG